VEVVTNSLPDTIDSDHSAGGKLTYTTRPPNKKLLQFPVTQDDVATRLLNWIRGIVQSNQELVNALERLRLSFEALLDGTPVTDAKAILWQVEVALKNAERSKTALALKSFQGPGRD
jgi:hypothetical protein